MEKLIENEYATLVCYPKEKIVCHTFHQFINGNAFREVMSKGADAFVQNRCTKWLSEDGDNPELKKEDVDWGEKFWEKRILAAGWKYWALVMPENKIGQLTLRAIMQRYQEMGVTIQIFKNHNDALNWLEMQN